MAAAGRVTVLGCTARTACLLLALALVVHSESGSNDTVSLLDEEISYEDDVNGTFEGNTTQVMPTLRHGLARLTFNNCGEETDPLYIMGFDVQPNPIEIPGPLSVGISFKLNENVSSPVSVQLEMKKRLNFLFGLSTWFTIPCLQSGVGSCHYEDICKLGLFSKDVCLDPDTEEEIACQCPFHEGEWKMKPSMFDVPRIPEDIPSYLLQGEFSIKATLFRKEEQIACYSTDVELNL